MQYEVNNLDKSNVLNLVLNLWYQFSTQFILVSTSILLLLQNLLIVLNRQGLKCFTYYCIALIILILKASSSHSTFVLQITSQLKLTRTKQLFTFTEHFLRRGGLILFPPPSQAPFWVTDVLGTIMTLNAPPSTYCSRVCVKIKGEENTGNWWWDFGAT